MLFVVVALGGVWAVSAGGVSPAVATAQAPWLGLVANNEYPHNSVGSFDPVSASFGSDIDVGGDNTWVGVSPDGTRAYANDVYVTHALKVVDLASKSVVDTSQTTSGSQLYGAMAPDGSMAYLSGADNVVPIDLTTSPPTVEAAIAVANASVIAITPDGTTAYVGSGILIRIGGILRRRVRHVQRPPALEHRIG